MAAKIWRMNLFMPLLEQVALGTHNSQFACGLAQHHPTQILSMLASEMTEDRGWPARGVQKD